MTWKPGGLLCVLLAGLACETSPSDPDASQASFALAELEDVTLRSGERMLIKILVLRKDKAGPPVTLSVEGLPPYASFEGETLTLAPGEKEWGESQVRVIATDGNHTASDDFLIRVIRPNKAPLGGRLLLEDEGGIPVDPTDGVVRGTPTIWDHRADEDMDAVRLLVELVPIEADFTGVPTHVSEWVRGDNWKMRVPLPGLPAGKRFKVRAWPEDELGTTGAAGELVGLVYLPRASRPAVAQERTCGGAQVDVSSDPRHCGECGHDCLGAACAQGICAPAQLTGPTMEIPKGLAVDSDSVYWMGDGKGSGLYRLPKAGGASVMLNRGYGNSLAVDSANAYMVETGLLIVPLQGTQSAFYDPTPGGGNLVSYGDELYWTSNQTLRARPKKLSGGASIVASLPNYPTGLRVDASGFYLATVDGSVFHRSWASNALTLLASGLNRVSGLAVDEQFVYVAHGAPECAACPSFCGFYRPFSCFTSSTLVRIPKAGGAPEVLAQVSGMANTLTVEGEFLYWSHDGRVGDLPLAEGSVMRMPKAGGAPLVLVDGFSGVRSLALDEQYVYGYDPAKGVFRAPK